MLNFPKLQLTDQGKILIAESLKGIPYTFTKFQLGDGTPLVSTANMTALAHAVITLPITGSVQTGAGAITLSARFDNADIESALAVSELGIYAQQDGHAEVLYAYTHETNNPSVIPSYPTQGFMEQVLSYTVAVGDASNFSVIIDASSLQHVSGTYTGNGAAGRVINVGFTPSAVMVHPIYVDPDHITDAYGGLAVTNANVISALTASAQREDAITTWSDTYGVLGVTTSGFKVNYNALNNIRSNENGRIYAYIAFK